MITGAHVLVYSKDPQADRDFLRAVLGLPYADAGDGWLIFALPPAEVAVHPGRRNGVHELYLICDDIARFVARMARRRVRCGPLCDQGWGLLTRVSLPGGGTLGVYEPRHVRPESENAEQKPQTPASKRRGRTRR
jgi:catechol 2,3-dioxygenase-like lactoylglutathione lyase family enzyme